MPIARYIGVALVLVFLLGAHVQASGTFKTGKVATTTIDHSPVGTTTAALSYGLVGYWPLDGNLSNWKVASSAIDISGSGNSGRTVGLSTTTTPRAGRIGQAWNFNGSGAKPQYVQLSSSTATSINTNMTWSAWVKPADSGTNYAIQRGSQFSITALYSVSLANIGVQFPSMACRVGTLASSVASNVSLSAAQATNAWHLLTCTTDTSKMYSYWDGVLLATTDRSSIVAVAGGDDWFAIGTANANQSFFHGGIDDVRVYNRMLSAQEVKQLFTMQTNIDHSNVGTTTAPLSSGLVSYIPFDGGTLNWATGKVSDISGSVAPLQLIAMSTSTSPTQGKVGQALQFNGSNSAVTLATSAYKFATTTFAVSGWFKTNTTVSNSGIVDQGDAATGWFIGLTATCSNKLVVFTKDTNNTGPTRCSTTSINDNKWHSFSVVITTDSVTFSNNNIVIYIDGQLDQGALTTTSFGYRGNTGTFVIGKRTEAAVFFKGAIDDVRIYNRGLSAREAYQLWAATK